MGFTKLGLSDQILQGVRAAGYAMPTPIQSLAIQPASEGRDVIGCAQTGTGKTAAFVLPLLHRLAGSNATLARHKNPRALILTPTRELAQQVQDAVVTYGRFLPFRAISVYGGVSMGGQLKMLCRGVDIVIATPGRLLDHMQRRTIDLSHVQVLVLDEADRMLDMGFINDVRKIVAAVPAQRQTMLFSATISAEISALAGSILRNPQMIEVGERRIPVQTITQHFYATPASGKMDLLFHILDVERMESVLVFARTKHGADKITRRLERTGIRSVAIHSNRTQGQRQRALDGFKEGQFRVLVATDIAARGIDVDGISHVINYDIPHYAEDYIHRIGRTGRMGATGDAITFVADQDRQHVNKIEKFIGRKFPVRPYFGFTPPAKEAAEGQVSASRVEGHTPHRHTHGTDKRQHLHGRKKRRRFEFARKKKPAPKTQTFSSDTDLRPLSI